MHSKALNTYLELVYLFFILNHLLVDLYKGLHLSCGDISVLTVFVDFSQIQELIFGI